jgi:uncharacterized protein
MEITEHDIHLLTKVEQSVQDSNRDFADLAHGFEHVQRVYHLAMHLAEQADGLIVGMAALLHDVGRTTRGPTRSHAARSAKLAKQVLTSYELPQERQQPIIHAILSHGYRRGTRPETLDAQVLYDADRLDSLGASGVMRWSMNMKQGRRSAFRTYHPDDPFALWREPDGQRYLLDCFFTKLLKLQEATMTASGRAMVERRIAFLRIYLQELARELAEGGSGYDMPEEITNGLIWRKYREGGEETNQLAEVIQPVRVVEMFPQLEEQHSA